MICLDSDCIMDYLNGYPAAKAIEMHHDRLVTTEINLFEVFRGIYSQKIINRKEDELAQSFFRGIEILSTKPGWGLIAARLLSRLRKQGKEIEQTDCFIAAIMQIHGCNKIITRNVKHYSLIPGIQVISY